MKRKDFIGNMSLIGVGLSLTPWKLATAGPSIQRFRLPPASVHIPHGNFANTELDVLEVPEFGLECTVQLFMRNGIAACHDDLTVCSFKKGNELLVVCFTTHGPLITNGRIEGVQVTIDSINPDFFMVCSA